MLDVSTVKALKGCKTFKALKGGYWLHLANFNTFKALKTLKSELVVTSRKIQGVNI